MSTEKQVKALRLAATGSVLLFAVTAYIASARVLPPWEILLFQYIYVLPDTLRMLVLLLTFFGSTWFFFGLTIVTSFFRRRLALELLVTGGLTYLIIQASKVLVGRPRPLELLPDVVSRELFVQGFGFPSGHTAIAATLSLMLALNLPRAWRWLPFVWIPAVAFSRMYLGVHTLLDIVGGFAVGVFVVSVYLLFLQKRIFKAKKAD